MQYRCYYFGARGQLLGADTIIQEGDSDAIAAARKLFAQHAHAIGYDLRQGTRSVEAKEIPHRPHRHTDTSRAA
ncbi:MAG TPA: hypothetical protein VHX19_09895 [Stellaceae bacterium]|jgi:hypothetical protein|nr:hypothetical protein [Stellaceae bacterium]